jgi:hypothetical protein
MMRLHDHELPNYLGAVKGFRVGAVALVLLATGCSSSTQVSSEAAGALAQDAGSIPQTQLVAPPLTVTVDVPGSDPGFVFINGGGAGAANLFGSGIPEIASGPEILDKKGRPVWFLQIPNDQDAGNFQVQTYQGKPVLTWFQGTKLAGADYIADTNYKIIKKITPHGAPSDFHEFRITPDGRALITSVNTIDADLTGIGGPKNGKINNSIVNVVDIASGNTLLEWDSAQHLPVTDSALSYRDLSNIPGQAAVAPLHINSVALDPDGDLLVSVRAANEMVAVDAHTGAVKWKLGGKDSTFTLGPGADFAGQHDPQFVDANTIMLFNNNVDLGGTRHGPSSIKWLRLDHQTRTATLVREWTQPDNLGTFTQGSVQSLPGGNTFTGWGDANRITEFAADGRVLWSAGQPANAPQKLEGNVGSGGIGTYRAFLQPWVGHPTQKPELAITTGNGQPTLHAVWNGATEVTHWRILTGPTPDALKPLLTAPWNGLNTPIPVPTTAATAGAYFQIQALDKTGTTIGSSDPTKI